MRLPNAVPCLDITVEKDVEVSLERLVEYFILHSNNVAALDKELSLSLICTEKVLFLLVLLKRHRFSRY